MIIFIVKIMSSEVITYLPVTKKRCKIQNSLPIKWLIKFSMTSNMFGCANLWNSKKYIVYVYIYTLRKMSKISMLNNCHSNLNKMLLFKGFQMNFYIDLNT